MINSMNTLIHKDYFLFNYVVDHVVLAQFTHQLFPAATQRSQKGKQETLRRSLRSFPSATAWLINDVGEYWGIVQFKQEQFLTLNILLEIFIVWTSFILLYVICLYVYISYLFQARTGYKVRSALVKIFHLTLVISSSSQRRFEISKQLL